MGKRLCFAALALLIPAAMQAQGLESLLSSMEEANEEAEQKGFCDKELATNKATRTQKSDEVLLLTSEIDELEA